VNVAPIVEQDGPVQWVFGPLVKLERRIHAPVNFDFVFAGHWQTSPFLDNDNDPVEPWRAHTGRCGRGSWNEGQDTGDNRIRSGFGRTGGIDCRSAGLQRGGNATRGRAASLPDE